jgi:hypothetical protein
VSLLIWVKDLAAKIATRFQLLRDRSNEQRERDYVAAVPTRQMNTSWAFLQAIPVSCSRIAWVSALKTCRPSADVVELPLDVKQHSVDSRELA